MPMTTQTLALWALVALMCSSGVGKNSEIGFGADGNRPKFCVTAFHNNVLANNFKITGNNDTGEKK